MGGTPTWKNVVAACSNCNLRKSDLRPGEARMWPARMPYQPTINDLHQSGRRVPPNYLHESLSARKLDGLSLLGFGLGAVTRARARAQIPARLGRLDA
jgi:hypothetical protein